MLFLPVVLPAEEKRWSYTRKYSLKRKTCILIPINIKNNHSTNDKNLNFKGFALFITC